MSRHEKGTNLKFHVKKRLQLLNHQCSGDILVFSFKGAFVKSIALLSLYVCDTHVPPDAF